MHLLNSILRTAPALSLCLAVGGALMVQAVGPVARGEEVPPPNISLRGRSGLAGTLSAESGDAGRVAALNVDGYRLEDSGLHLLRTGSGEPLQTWSLALEPPPGVASRRLEFTVGFASGERIEPGAFLDSFSVSLRGPTPSGTALLLTADAPGFVWRPPLPGGLALEPASLRIEERDWGLPPDQTPGVHFSYRVTLELPVAFQRGPFELLGDLFDNGDLRVSLGYVDDVVLGTAPFFLVESAASPQGPYAVETTARHDAAARTFRLVRPDASRFFRLKADSPAVLTILEPTPGSWRFRYVFPGATPVLESAPAPAGPYRVETSAVLDAAARMYRLPAEGSGRFFRLSGPVRADLLMPRAQAGRLELRFEVNPRVFSLQSSSQPGGPFADEETAHFDRGQQTIELARPEVVRFFRLSQSDKTKRTVIREIRLEPDAWVLRYDVEPAAP